jgi:predicted phage terminase large subunit-like protein
MTTSNNLPLTSAELDSISSLRNFASEREEKQLIELLTGQPQLPPSLISPQPQLVYSPHTPTAKQQEFLALKCREALFGGAAGGGKSEAILMAALQYVHVPGYAAIILRKDTQRLQLAGGLVPRSHEWLADSPAKWNRSKLQWRFPTGGAPATLSFGYLQTAADKYRYGSSEYQYIAFDELTELAEEDYLFLFSRLRSTKNIGVPLRMRAASNPGGPGHAWVKERFIDRSGSRETSGLHCEDSDACLRDRDCSKDARTLTSSATGKARTLTSSATTGRVFLPATIADNPHLNADDYRQSLAHLPSVLRERLERGDWSIHEAGLVQSQWLRYFVVRGQVLELFDAAGNLLAQVDDRQTRRFATIDPAGTSEDRAKERRGRPASWSVIQVWDQPKAAPLSQFLMLRHQVRQQVPFDRLCGLLRQTHRQWQPQRLFIENEKLGRAACDVLRRELPISCIATAGQDKLTRAAPLLAKLERGEVFLPRAEPPWLRDLEAEWLAWTGTDESPSDQVDAAAYAVQVQQKKLLPLRVKLPLPFLLPRRF